MKILLFTAGGTVSLLTTAVALAQNGTMMNGGASGFGWMGGSAGVWVALSLIAAVPAIVVLVVQRKDK
jgi:hypothetical protein